MGLFPIVVSNQKLRTRRKKDCFQFFNQNFRRPQSAKVILFFLHLDVHTLVSPYFRVSFLPSKSRPKFYTGGEIRLRKH